MALTPPQLTLLPFQPHQFIQEGFVTETSARGFDREVRHALGHRLEFKRAQERGQFPVTVAHRSLPCVNN